MVWPVIAIIAASGGLTLLAWWFNRRRRKKLEALAKSRGWSFTWKNHELVGWMRAQGFDLFDVGHNRQARNVIDGERDGVQFRLYDYLYTTSDGGKNRQVTRHVVCHLRMPLDAPNLHMQEEHLGLKLWDAVGGEDIDFESDAFSRRFWVRCDDRRFAYDVIHPEVMEYLLAAPKRVWAWRGSDLVVYHKGKLKPDAVEDVVDLVVGLRKRLPRHLLAEQASSRHG